MDTKHTPGPFRVGGTCKVRYMDGTEETLRCVAGAGLPVVALTTDKDAPLLAAAPELADAAEGWKAAPPVTPRRPLDDGQPDGYLESFDDWCAKGDNRAAVEWFLENRDVLVAATEKALRGAGRLA